jgi:hypothetical protein
MDLMNFDPSPASMDAPMPSSSSAAKPEPDDDFDNEVLGQPGEGTSCGMEPGCTSCE